MNGTTSDMLKWMKKNHPKAWRDYLDQKTTYKKVEGGIKEIENLKFIGPKKFKGGLMVKPKAAKRGY